eukprot:3739827-Amphidinium_carterae.1
MTQSRLSLHDCSCASGATRLKLSGISDAFFGIIGRSWLASLMTDSDVVLALSDEMQFTMVHYVLSVFVSFG